jgi:putative tryptophan/tyrosine transport system substrate-binding protein
VIVSVAVWPLGARAEQPAMPVIGFLAPGIDGGADAAPGCRISGSVWPKRGYVEGKNLAIEYRYANFQS